MSVAGIASNLPFQSVNQAFFFQRRLDVVELGREINSGDLNKAQQVYDALAALGQNADGYKPFKNSTLEMTSSLWAKRSRLGTPWRRSRLMQLCSRLFGRLTSEGGRPRKSSLTSKRLF